MPLNCSFIPHKSGFQHTPSQNKSRAIVTVVSDAILYIPITCNCIILPQEERLASQNTCSVISMLSYWPMPARVRKSTSFLHYGCAREGGLIPTLHPQSREQTTPTIIYVMYCYGRHMLDTRTEMPLLLEHPMTSSLVMHRYHCLEADMDTSTLE